MSGDELAAKAMRQARRLGAEIIVTRAIEGIDPDAHTVTLDGGAVLRTKVVILTSGVEWRHVEIPDIDRFVGNGVYYGAARSDSGIAHGKDVYIIGAGNSAGQAAIFFSRRSKSVTLIVRGESLGASMSQYLIEQLAANPNVTVETRSEVVALHGAEKLESIDVIDRRTQTVTTRDAEVLFVMIGADAETSWLPDAGRARRERLRAHRSARARRPARWTQAAGSVRSRDDGARGSSPRAMCAPARSSASRRASARAAWRSRSCTSTWRWLPRSRQRDDQARGVDREAARFEERTAPMLAAITSAMPTSSSHDELLTEQQPPGERGGRRREAHQDRERPPRAAGAAR